jgi:AcrR family transcriptional regulator
MSDLERRRPKLRRPRADARRNHEQILRATADLIVEHGPGTPMETIARRAKVGIATLYRHFPDRLVLLRQVAVDTLRQSTREARSALEEEPDAFTALARFMHNSIDMKIGAVMPVLAARFAGEEELGEVWQEAVAAREALEALLAAARAEGTLRPDVTAGDIGLLIVRFTPPMGGSISPEDSDRLSHRHLELMLDGLLRFLTHEALPGPAMSFEELLRLNPAPDGEVTNELAAKERLRQSRAAAADSEDRSRKTGS